MKNIFAVLFVGIFTPLLFSQVDNVPIDDNIYDFFKEMKVKGVIADIHDWNPLMSRGEAIKLLKEIESNRSSLSQTERNILDFYKVEFFYDEYTDENTTQLIGNPGGFSGGLGDLFGDKQKFLYKAEEGENNLYIEWLGNFYYGQFSEPSVNNAEMFDIGFRFRGTVFGKLGYYLDFIKGGIAGNTDMALTIDPRLRYNFKVIEDLENIGNYDFTHGYLRYASEPTEGMNISAEIGREKLLYGYGYGSRFIVAGNQPDFDFFKFDFNYDIVRFNSIHASTQGDFNHMDRSLNYTKYIAINSLHVNVSDLFEAGIGESIVYSGRGIEFAYLAPLLFYKFAEMSLQDRDNGTLFLDLQTKSIPNLELQGTFFLDENILGNLQDLDRYSNKTAYQLGAFWYEAFTLNDLSLMLEYTRIRPYVYSHYNPKNDYTAWGVGIGHEIGPNADEIFTGLRYNLNERIRLAFDYRKIRRGENVYDDEGTLIKNVGGDIKTPYRENIDPETAVFLDGIRIDTHILRAGIRYEPIRDFTFELSYNYRYDDNITAGTTETESFGVFHFILEY